MERTAGRSINENRSPNGRDAGEIVESNGRAGKNFFALDNFTLKKVDFKRFFGYYIKRRRFVSTRRPLATRAARPVANGAKAKIGEKNERRVRNGAATTGSKARE